MVLNYNSVKLWFAKDDSGKIVTIDEVNENNKHNTYSCPICGSNLRPKAVKSKQVTSHFAHVDSSKCNSETVIHWWFKHRFLEKGDSFKIISDKERQYICKDILVEQLCSTGGQSYRPDVVVLTECGNTIYFEMAFSNKKKVKDYIDIWMELKNIVVEVDIKNLMNRDEIPTFTSLFHDGKCFNTKRNDTYCNTIDEYRESRLSGNINQNLKERVKNLEWFWDDVLRYKNGEIGIEDMVELIDFIEINDKDVLYKILNKNKCLQVYEDYLDFRLNRCYKEVKQFLLINLNKECLIYLDKYLMRYKNHTLAYIAIRAFYPLGGGGRSLYCKFNGYSKGGLRDSYDINDYSQHEMNVTVLKQMKLNLDYIKKDKLAEKRDGKIQQWKANQVVFL